MKRALIILGICAIFILALVSPHIIRDSDALMGYDVYYHTRIIEMLKSDDVQKDPLIYGGRGLSYSGTHVLFSLLDNQIYLKTVPPLIGVLTFFLFYLILKKLRMTDKQATYTLILFAFSPVFIYTFTQINNYFLIIFLGVLAAYLLVSEKYIISALIFCTLPFFNAEALIAVLFLLLLIYQKQKGKNHVLISAIIIIITLIYVYLHFPSIKDWMDLRILIRFISDFGADYGTGIFTAILFFAGIILSWNKKEEYSLLYVVLGCAFVLSYFEKTNYIFVEFGIVFFAGLAYTKISEAKWKLETLKEYTLLLIFCGLLFSAGSYINRMGHSPPTESEIESLEWLKSNSDNNELVLSEYRFGFFIQNIASRIVLTDTLYFITSKEKTRINDTHAIFTSRNLEETSELLDKYKVKYIWINPAMKSGLVWKKQEEGLLFLLENSEKFKNVYNYHGIEIWEYD